MLGMTLCRNSLLLALAQLNPVDGRYCRQSGQAARARQEAARQGAHLLDDLRTLSVRLSARRSGAKAKFSKCISRSINILRAETADGGPAILLGTPWVEEGKLYNAVLLLDRGRIAAKIFKHDLPNYGPFDEKRVFRRGAVAGADGISRHQTRRDDLRRYVDARVAAHLKQTGRADFAGAEWQPL